MLTVVSAGALTPLVGAYWAGVAGGALAGATIGGAFAAATGGNIGQGLLAGAIGGAVFAGLAPGLSSLTSGLARGASLGSGVAGPLTSGWSMAANFTSGFIAGAGAGAAVAGAYGGDVGQGALFGGVTAGVFSLARDAASIMRAKTVAQSRLDPRNASGISDGLNGDGFKTAGVRAPLDPLQKAKSGLFGGRQGGPGTIFGIPYSSDGIVNHIMESFGGTHDLLNSWTYSANGDLRNLNLVQRSVNFFTNPLNIGFAAPFAVASALPPVGAAGPTIIYGPSQDD